MPRFLGNWEVESDMVLPEGTPFLRYDHPASKYTIFLRNIREDRTDDFAYISMQVVFDAPQLFEAKAIGEQCAREFLDYLAFSTNLKARLRTLFHIYSWEEGRGMRHGLIWTRPHAHDDAPYPVLTESILGTVGLLQANEAPPRLRRALKWFATAIASRAPDDQFAYFWFVIELVAQLIKEPTPIPDKCPTCRSPLSCEKCGTSPLHRPYPKQAIEQLFHRYVTNEPESEYRLSNAARNMLMHGDDTASIERELQIEFPDLVNKLGKIAWVALANQFIPALVNKDAVFVETSRYVHMSFSGMAHIQTAFVPNFTNPDPAHFPDIKFSAVQMDRQDESLKRNTEGSAT
jgi:hypothetical protein